MKTKTEKKPRSPAKDITKSHKAKSIQTLIRICNPNATAAGIPATETMLDENHPLRNFRHAVQSETGFGDYKSPVLFRSGFEIPTSIGEKPSCPFVKTLGALCGKRVKT